MIISAFKDQNDRNTDTVLLQLPQGVRTVYQATFRVRDSKNPVDISSAELTFTTEEAVASFTEVNDEMVLDNASVRVDESSQVDRNSLVRLQPGTLDTIEIAIPADIGNSQSGRVLTYPTQSNSNVPIVIGTVRAQDNTSSGAFKTDYYFRFILIVRYAVGT